MKVTKLLVKSNINKFREAYGSSLKDMEETKLDKGFTS